MSISADLQRLAQMRMEPDRGDGPDLSALQSTVELLAYLVACARSEGKDEADWCELFCRGSHMTPDAVRTDERLLRKLGYRAVSNRLRQIAGRRKHDLSPL